MGMGNQQGSEMERGGKEEKKIKERGEKRDKGGKGKLKI